MTEIGGRLKAVGAWLKTGGRTVGAWLAAVFAWVWRPYRQWSRRRKLAAAVAGLLLGLVLADAVARAAWGAALRRWVAAGPMLGPLFFYDAGDAPAWKDRVTALTLLFSAVIGYLLWHWRDVNARHTIENQRKDVNLKEFQEIQLRAAGALDRDKLGAETCDQLQIAALHQLRGFLRGEYGAAFQRPAFELLLAGHAIAMERNGWPKRIRKVMEWLDGRESKPKARKILVGLSKALNIAQSQLTAVDKERMGILRDESAALFKTGFPLEGRSLDFVVWDRANLEGRNLSRCSLIGADLRFATLNGANFMRAHLERANLIRAQLKQASLSGAHLELSRLSRSNLAEARAFGANFALASLSHANLRGAGLSLNQLKDARLMNAVFDDTTAFTWRWDELSADQRREYHQKLRALDARHVDDPEDEEDNIPF